MFFVRLDGHYPDFVPVIALHFDYCFWTDNSAHSAPCTVGIICLGGEIAGFIRTLGYDDVVFRADYYTKPTAFAPLSIDYYFASHLLISFNCSLQGLQVPFGEFKHMDFNSDECFCKGKSLRLRVF
jgi:hypothetical protein